MTTPDTTNLEGFNIRVYGLIHHEHSILVLYEPFMGQMIYKFPGGGLELGEGTIACLKRECQEELSMDIANITHLYTQDFFVVTQVHTTKQLFTIYYEATVENIAHIHIVDPHIEQYEWVPINDLDIHRFTLPTDKEAIKKWKMNL